MMMVVVNKKNKEHHGWSRTAFLFVAVAALLLYAVLPQVGNFRNSLQVIVQAHIGWLVIAVSCLICTYLLAGLMYFVLALRPMSLRSTMIVQVAGNFTNRLLPAGIGALAVSYEYLRKQGHNKMTAAAIVTVNNVLGFVGNLVLLAAVAVIVGSQLKPVNVPQVQGIWIGALVLAVVLAFLLLSRATGRLRKGVQHFVQTLRFYRYHPLRLLLAGTVSIAITACFASILFACAQAVGAPLPFAIALVVMSIGVLGGTATPTPGGLGGAEAGLVAACVAYGVPAAEALAIALLYRLLTFWLSLVLGVIAFMYARRQRYI